MRMPNEEFGAEIVNLANDAGVKELELGDGTVMDVELERLGLKILRKKDLGQETSCLGRLRRKRHTQTC